MLLCHHPAPQMFCSVKSWHSWAIQTPGLLFFFIPIKKGSCLTSLLSFYSGIPWRMQDIFYCLLFCLFGFDFLDVILLLKMPGCPGTRFVAKTGPLNSQRSTCPVCSTTPNSYLSLEHGNKIIWYCWMNAWNTNTYKSYRMSTICKVTGINLCVNLNKWPPLLNSSKNSTLNLFIDEMMSSVDMSREKSKSTIYCLPSYFILLQDLFIYYA